MKPILSYIIPCRNALQHLPNMLESIHNQSFKSLEVVIVDDCSSESYSELATAFRNKGLEVSVVVSSEWIGTKNARLLGVEHAKGDIIAFADADDVLWGTDNLEYNVNLFQSTGADILQFPCVELNGQGQYVGMNHNTPLGERLLGKDIFPKYIRGSLFGICCHLYDKKCWLRLIPQVRPFPLWHQLEDLCLLLFYYGEAKVYIGSTHVGYGYKRCLAAQRSLQPWLDKAESAYTLFKLFPEYLRAQEQEEQVIEDLSMRLLQILCLFTGRACMANPDPTEFIDYISNKNTPVFLACVAESLTSNAHKVSALRQLLFSTTIREKS